jgi:hypothetical protein
MYCSHEARTELPVCVTLDGRLDFSVNVPLANPQTESEVYAPMRDIGCYESLASVGRGFRAGTFSQSTSLYFCVYATTYNEDRQECFTDVGVACVALLELTQRNDWFRIPIVLNTVNVSRKASMSRTLEAEPRAEPSLVKGHILVRRAVFSGTRPQFLPLQPAFDTYAPDVSVRLQLQKRAQTIMQEIADRELRPFFNAEQRLSRLSSPILHGFHTVEYRPNHHYTHLCGYVVQRSLRATSAEYFFNAMTIVLERHRSDVVTMASYGRALLVDGARGANRHAFLSYLGAVLMLHGNSVVYMDDCINRNRAGYEWRNDLIEVVEDNKARWLDGDDCEGSGNQGYKGARDALVVLRDVGDANPMTALATLMYRLLRLYVPGLVLAASTNKSLRHGAMSLTINAALAHTFTMLVPYELFARLDNSGSDLSQSRFYRERATELEQSVRLRLPPLIIEGTSCMESTAMAADACYDEHEDESRCEIGRSAYDAQVDANECVHAYTHSTRWQTELMCFADRDCAELSDNTKPLSTFYVWLCMFVTTCFERRIGWAFTYRRNNTSIYGVTFNDFMRAANRTRASVALERVVTLSETEAAMTDVFLSTTEPEPPLIAPANPTPRLADGVQKRLDALVRHGSPGACTPMHRRRYVMTVRLRDLGEREMDALEHIARDARWTAISWSSRALAAPLLDGLPPLEFVDVILDF